MKLNNLQISCFRGATKPITIDFDKAKEITMIFAENGNGKSTIADALISLLTNKFGSLDDRASIDPQFIKALGTGMGEARITLDTDTGIFTASMAGTAKVFTKTPSTGLPELRFLRRSQIIDLMNRPPNARYATLANYIDVSGIYTSEEELRKGNREIEQNLENSIGILSSAKETLEQAWIKEGEPDCDMMAWAKAQSEIDVSKDKIALDTLNKLTNEWRSIDNKNKEIEQSVVSCQVTESVRQSAEDAFKKLQIESSKNNASLLTLLQQAKSYISSQDAITNCPVCSNDIEKGAVVSSLTKEIASMDALAKAAKLVEETKRNHDRNVVIQNKAIETLSGLLVKYKNSIAKYKTRELSIAPFVDGIGSDINVNHKCFVENLTHLLVLYGKIEESERKKSKTIQQHNFIKTQYSAITSNTEKSEKLSKLSIATAKALNIVETARKEFYDNELLSISGEVERMYQSLHPLEGLGGIKLFLNPKFKTSLELQANFHTEQGITPQSLYSESHLDTLGICIFLALAKKYSDGNTILVLDDVVMSVDDKHLDRFVDLIHLEASNFGQVILTTHYRPWRERYRTHRAPGGKVHFIELRNWTQASGITLQNGRVELQELEFAVNDKTYFDRQAISSKSGILLENILDYLTDVYEYHLPKRKSLKYTLGELLDTLQLKYLKNLKTIHKVKKLNEAGVEEDVEIEYALQPIIDELKKLIFIRNQVGAHFNLDQDASDGDVELFGRKTIELGKTLICGETGQLPLTKSIDHWKSRNGTVKLFPVEKT